MGIGAAVAATAVAGVAGSVISASGASSAAKTQAGAAAAASAEQQAAGQQAVALNQQQQGAAQKLLQPYNAQGQAALGALNSKLNYLTTPYAPTQAQLAATPGYQFTLAQGLQATQNSAAAQGLGVSGAALKSAAAYATGQANSTYATNAGIYQQNQGQIGNLLTTLTSNGQNAANAQGQEALGFTGNASNALVGQANTSANTQLSGAAASAAGQVGSANAISNGLTGAAGSVSQGAILNSLLANNTAGGASASSILSGSAGLY